MFEREFEDKMNTIEAEILNEYFVQSRVRELKSLFEKDLEYHDSFKMELLAEDFHSVISYHKQLKNAFLNFQIISQIYYETIIKTMYLFHILNKINPQHEILKIGVDQILLKELLEFYPNNPQVVRMGWINRKIPIIGLLNRTSVL